MTAKITESLAAAPDRWVLRPSSRRCHLRLLCVPYAGGGAAVFHGWQSLLPAGVEVWALRLPGRDARFHEPLVTDLHALVDDAAQALAPTLEEPFAVFGHSLGAFIGYELVRRLSHDWGLQASMLAVSARDAPQIPSYRGGVHRLDDQDFIDVLDRQYRAIPPVIRTDPQMRELYLPILRADATMLETYRHEPGPALRCPVSVFYGEDDLETTPAGLLAWAELTTGGARLHGLPGGHFFLDSERARLARTLGTELTSTLIP